MSKRIALGVVAVLAGLGLWIYFSADEAPPKPEHVAEENSPPPPAEAPADEDPTPAHVAMKHAIAEKPAPPKKLDPHSEDFYERVDVAIPRHLFAKAAECDVTGAEKNEKMRVAIRVRAAEGGISVLEANILESTIVNKSLETCIRDAVKNATWQDDEMPDWEDEDEILIRIKGLKKHVPIPDDYDDSQEG